MLAAAHDQFRAGRYGRAIVEFDEIGKVFGDRADQGMHRYWIARSWMALKEYNTARQILTDFIQEYPTGPWAPRSELELARVEWRLGLQETALKRFRDIIQKHPYEDAAEMAKMELQNLDKSL
jgi:TolA-binding protein